jgi:E3 ubiquitin-protein ligase ZNF598
MTRLTSMADDGWIMTQEPQESVIFTLHPEAHYASYATEKMPFIDSKLGIYFETREMKEDTLILLRYR